MTPERFHELAAQGYNHIPLIREAPADLETPLSVYLKLAAGPGSYLLESVQGGERWGRYSIIGLPCARRLEAKDDEVVVRDGTTVRERARSDDPLAWIEGYQRRRKAPVCPELPRFCGGLVGYFGYEIVRHLEPSLRGSCRPDPLGGPDACLLVSDEIVVFDNLNGRLYIVVHADPGRPAAYETAQARLDELAARLYSTSLRYAPAAAPAREAKLRYGLRREDFETAVRKIKRYIVAGEVMQVVLSQRLSAPLRVPPMQLYRALRSLNPSPYLYYFDLGGLHIVGSSPEVLVRLEQDVVTVRPIAGTRPRGGNEAEERRLERELLADPKERAEHLMLIDLGRNDVGRAARIGSVKVTERMAVERYSHVMHMVSNVTGRLRPGQGAMDALRATFPAGTVTGAPKIRAMEIIGELEPAGRGIYSGAVGYLSWSGNMDLAIAIRTALIQDGTIHVQAGAGIVADSHPRREWEETLNKGQALFQAARDAGRYAMPAVTPGPAAAAGAAAGRRQSR
ncbi:MAG: anthranilate synthase component I [Gammaproteobacteria bacterium]|nr:anthranilate synthase component I [Gammaproteobacteria bacterium]